MALCAQLREHLFFPSPNPETPKRLLWEQADYNVDLCWRKQSVIRGFFAQPNKEQWEYMVDSVFCELYEDYVLIPTFDRMHKLAFDDTPYKESPVVALSDSDLVAALRQEEMSPSIFASVLLWFVNQSSYSAAAGEESVI